MAQRLIAPLAPGLELTGGYIVRLVALDPTTGAAVGGVVVSNVAMQADRIDADTEPEPVAVTAPLFTYGGV